MRKGGIPIAQRLRCPYGEHVGDPRFRRHAHCKHRSGTWHGIVMHMSHHGTWANAEWRKSERYKEMAALYCPEASA